MKVNGKDDVPYIMENKSHVLCCKCCGMLKPRRMAPLVVATVAMAVAA